MVDNYIVGSFFASLVGFVLLYIFRSNATAEADKKRDHRRPGVAFDEIRNDCVRSSTNGEVRPKGGPETDVVIVGAGVAGASLAHTLGKVRSSLRFLRKLLHSKKREREENSKNGFYVFFPVILNFLRMIHGPWKD